jgi:hypothetical protein
VKEFLMRWLRKNIAVDGDGFLERPFGWSWLPALAPSAEAKQNRDIYETWIERLLGYISTPAVGYWIVGSIQRAASHRVLIKPWQAPDEDSKRYSWERLTPDNAYVIPSDWAGAANPNEVIQRREHEMSDGRTWVEEIKGSGHGSDAFVYMTPWFLPSLSTQQCPRFAGRAPDEVLLHEMVHALNVLTHQLAGYESAPAGFGNLEEFTAVLFTNLYSSQTGRPLRADHSGHEQLPAPGRSL